MGICAVVDMLVRARRIDTRGRARERDSSSGTVVS
jgi:hypothetical protein